MAQSLPSGLLAEPIGRPEVRPAEAYDATADLWVISTYFNSHQYHTKATALARFLESLRSSGLHLLFVEGAFGDAPFTVPNGADVVHVRCRDVMWQKERLLNLAIARLPSDCKKVAWLDADVLFSDPEWAVKTSRLLDRFTVVQPFEAALWLPQGDDYFRGRGLVWPSFARAFHDLPGEFLTGNFDRHGHCGYAWAARKDILQRHGLFDRSIAGGGDHLMAHAMAGDFESICVQKMVGNGTAYSREFRRWAEPFHREVRSEIGAVPGYLLHLWHGDKVKRRYSERSRELLDIHFDPSQDLRIGESGGWEWARGRPELRAWAGEYFARREEDAPPEADYALPETILEDTKAALNPELKSLPPPADPRSSRKPQHDPLRTMALSEDWY